jgi:hypothetical protein
VSKMLFLNIRDVILGICIGAAPFGTGYVFEATYPPSGPDTSSLLRQPSLYGLTFFSLNVVT